jgi:hypothetical protein
MVRYGTIIVALSIVLFGCAVALAVINENTGIPYGATQSITGPTAGGGTLCKMVTNNSPTGKQLYVPGSTAAEWDNFVAQTPTGVVLSNCCSGTLVGGYCWYLGASGQSCDTACSTHGGTNIAGTNGYAGAGGTNAQCQLVINTLDQPYTYAVSDNSQPGATAAGCGKVNLNGGERRRYLVNPTTGSATYPGFRRTCACNN